MSDDSLKLNKYGVTITISEDEMTPELEMFILNLTKPLYWVAPRPWEPFDEVWRFYGKHKGKS